MDPGATLRAARQRSGLTQGALAARAGTSQATISSYESGRKQPSVTTLSRLVTAAGWRLALERAEQPVIQPSAWELARAGAGLVEVMGLAEALPVRHDPELGFPRLPSRPLA